MPPPFSHGQLHLGCRPWIGSVFGPTPCTSSLSDTCIVRPMLVGPARRGTCSLLVGVHKLVSRRTHLLSRYEHRTSVSTVCALPGNALPSPPCSATTVRRWCQCCSALAPDASELCSPPELPQTLPRAARLDGQMGDGLSKQVAESSY